MRSSTESGVGSASSSTTLPSARKTTRSAYDAPRGSWVTMTMDWPNSVTDRLRNDSISAEAFESRLPVGSSAKMRSGRLISARAQAQRCCWPPDSSVGPVREPVRRYRAGPPGSRTTPGPPSSRPGPPARVMFSPAVSVGTRLKDWNTKPIRSRRSWVRPLSSRLPMSRSPTKRLSRCRPVEAGHAVHERRLARPRRAHDGGKAAPLEGDVDAGQGVDRGLAGAVGLTQLDRVRCRRVRSLGGRDVVSEGHGGPSHSLNCAQHRPSKSAERNSRFRSVQGRSSTVHLSPELPPRGAQLGIALWVTRRGALGSACTL